jgi:hypothetical protein
VKSFNGKSIQNEDENRRSGDVCVVGWFELCPNTAPAATVGVVRDTLNDTLVIHVTGLKPKLQFDLFTVQRSPFLADGMKDPNFPTTFGLAWYQSDLDADEDGKADISVPLRSIFLDQIFGFDGDKNPDGTVILPPVNTMWGSGSTIQKTPRPAVST